MNAKKTKKSSQNSKKVEEGAVLQAETGQLMRKVLRIL